METAKEGGEGCPLNGQWNSWERVTGTGLWPEVGSEGCHWPHPSPGHSGDSMTEGQRHTPATAFVSSPKSESLSFESEYLENTEFTTKFLHL